VSSKQHENDIFIVKGDRAEIRRIIESVQIKLKDNLAKFNILEKKLCQDVDEIREIHFKDIRKLEEEVEKLGTPVRQALEARQREADSIMYELKRAQGQTREVFSEFENSKRKLIEILDSAKNEGLPKHSLNNAVSMINLDTNILLSNERTSETIISTTVRNVPISPITQIRTETAKTHHSKMSLSKLPILASKQGYMTAREMTRNYQSTTSRSNLPSRTQICDYMTSPKTLNCDTELNSGTQIPEVEEFNPNGKFTVYFSLT
jgi:hypothetical protein